MPLNIPNSAWAIWKIEVEDFPAFILVDDKGNDFFTEIANRCSGCPIAK